MQKARRTATFHAVSESTSFPIYVHCDGVAIGAPLETTLSTLDSCMNMDEEPALKRPKYVAAAAKKTNIVTFK